MDSPWLSVQCECYKKKDEKYWRCCRKRQEQQWQIPSCTEHLTRQSQDGGSCFKDVGASAVTVTVTLFFAFRESFGVLAAFVYPLFTTNDGDKQILCQLKNMVQHPEVLWAQRSSETEDGKVRTPISIDDHSLTQLQFLQNVVYLTINLPDIQKDTLVCNITSDSLSFKATSGVYVGPFSQICFF